MQKIRSTDYEKQVASLQTALNIGDQAETDALYGQLSAFTPTGRFNGELTEDHLMEYSGIVALSCEGLPPAKLFEVLSNARMIDFTLAVYLSPSGKGLVILVKVNSDENQHVEAFDKVAAFYGDKLGVTFDLSGRDITTFQYMSYDPTASYKPDAMEFPVHQNGSVQEPQIAHSAEIANLPGGSLDESRGLDILGGLPCLPDTLFKTLPPILRECCRPFKVQREKDVVLMAALAAIGPCFPDVSTIYRTHKQYPTIFMLICAPPGCGKGVLLDACRIVKPIHKRLVKQTIKDLLEWRSVNSVAKRTKAPSTPKPPFKQFIHPANASSTNFIKLLSDNDGVGFMLESEADTLVATLKNDWGDYSDVLRKAFHHEEITLSRMAEEVCYNIECPRLSVAISGTPAQAVNLLKSTENGLFSRFTFYAFNSGLQWKPSVPVPGEIPIEEHFAPLGDKLLRMHDLLKGRPVDIEINDDLLRAIDTCFEPLHEEAYVFDEGKESIARRHAVMTVRIAILLTLLDYAEIWVETSVEPPSTIQCSEKQFYNALSITSTLYKHAMTIAKTLPTQDNNVFIRRPDAKGLFDGLPEQFSSGEAIARGEPLKISANVVNKHLKRMIEAGLLVKIRHGFYQKLQNKGRQNGNLAEPQLE